MFYETTNSSALFCLFFFFPPLSLLSVQIDKYKGKKRLLNRQITPSLAYLYRKKIYQELVLIPVLKPSKFLVFLGSCIHFEVYEADQKKLQEHLYIFNESNRWKLLLFVFL